MGYFSWNDRWSDSGLPLITSTIVPTTQPDYSLAGMGVFSDYDWFHAEIENAKIVAAQTGNVDGARSLIDKALGIHQSGAYFLQSSVDEAINAKEYVESFRAGSNIIGPQFGSASGAQQSYYGSDEQQRLAREQIAAEQTSQEVARGPFSFMYETAPFVAGPGRKAAELVAFGPAAYAFDPSLTQGDSYFTRDTVVEAATGAPAGSSIESATLAVQKAAEKGFAFFGDNWKIIAAAAAAWMVLGRRKK